MSGNTFIQDIRAKAAKKRLKVAFPDAEDVRTIQAALTLEAEKIAVPVLVGKAEAIRKIAGQLDRDFVAVVRFQGAATLWRVLCWITAGMTVLSGLHYTYIGLHTLQTGYGNRPKTGAE